MNGTIKSALALSALSILFFVLIADAWFSYTMFIIKAIFFLCGLVCIWGALDSFSRYFKAYNRKYKETVYNLIFRSGWKSAIVNLLTVYRIIITPFLIVLLFQESEAFKWFLISAFITDALDGFLARRFKVTTQLGAKLDSVADDCLFVLSVAAVIYLYPQILFENLYIILGLICIFLVKMLLLYVKHDKFISGLHTYLTKTAAFMQAVFFLHCIFFQPGNVLFYVMVGFTMVAMVEEIIIICSSKELRPNTKGLFFNRSEV